MAALAAAGIDYDDVTRTLEHDGLASFVASYDGLIAGVDEKRQRVQRASTEGR
jgi:hypothetical protein